MRIDKAERIDAFYDYAAAHPDGFTLDDAVADLDAAGPHKWTRSTGERTVRDLRLFFGGDVINLVCEPTGQGEPWLYRLVGRVEDAAAWIENRVSDTEARLETIHAVMLSDVAHSNGRTNAGKKARLIAKGVGRIIEDLRDIDDNLRFDFPD